MIMRKRALLTGIILWFVGALAIRLGGQYIFRLNLLLLYLLSFAAMAVLVPRILGGMGLEKDAWPAAATLLMLPTLILDSLACAFFSTVYPNLSPAAAGAFGGWMLIFCGGAAVGAWGPGSAAGLGGWSAAGSAAGFRSAGEAAGGPAGEPPARL